MKISQISYTGFGGLGSVVFSLLAADAGRRHKWSIGFIGDQPLDASYAKRCQDHGASFAVFQSTSGKPFRAWWALARWLEQSRPDVVICHSINAILACRWYAQRHGARLLAVEHTANNVKTRNEWVLSRLAMLLADRVVILTDQYRDELRKAHGWLYRGSKVVVVPNGIDTSVFRPAAVPSPGPAGPGRTLKIGMAARFSFSKRQDLLVAVLERLAALRPALAVQLRFAGDGTEMKRVQALAIASSVGSRISFDGLLSEEALALWLRDLTIYVHATEGETLSTSLLQAMATGLPIVASDVTGVNNLIDNGRALGATVANTADDFATAILELADNPDRWAACASHGREKAVARYGNETMLSRYLDILRPSTETNF
jgi:glycosyltransferase involved in cell wall biosynthesis